MPSSRPNPRTGEWERDSEQCVPDAALVAIKIRRKLDDCEIERSMSSGRIGVSRYVDDGVERAAVWLELGQAAGTTMPDSSVGLFVRRDWRTDGQ